MIETCNIAGKEYVCPRCKKTYMAPNPLKLHLARACDSISSTAVWDRLTGVGTQSPDLSPWRLPFLFPTSSNGLTSLPIAARSNFSTVDQRSIPAIAYNIHDQGLRLRKSVTFYPQNKEETCLWKDRYNTTRPFVNCVIKNAAQLVSTAENEAPRSAFHPVVSQECQIQEIKSTSSVLSNKSETQSLSSQIPSSTSCHLTDLVNRKVAIRNLINHSEIRSNQSSSPRNDPCAEVEAFVSNLGRGRGGHICLYCGKVYSRKYGLKIHIRTHTGYKPLSCRVCHRAFGDPSNLNKHVRLHAEGATPYRCQHCGKVLVRQRDLARHLAARHPDKPSNSNVLLTDEEDGVTTSEDEHVEVVKIETNSIVA